MISAISAFLLLGPPSPADNARRLASTIDLALPRPPHEQRLGESPSSAAPHPVGAVEPRCHYLRLEAGPTASHRPRGRSEKSQRILRRSSVRLVACVSSASRSASAFSSSRPFALLSRECAASITQVILPIAIATRRPSVRLGHGDQDRSCRPTRRPYQHRHQLVSLVPIRYKPLRQ